MSLTKRLRPGGALDADEVEQNFTDLDSLISPVAALQLEDGAIHTRHAETVTAWKTQETKADFGGATVLGGSAVVVPTAPSTYDTYSGEAVLIRAVARAQGTAVDPWVKLSIKVGGSAVIERTWDFPTNCAIHARISWLVEASTSTTTIELFAEGANASLYDAHLTALSIRR